MTEQGIDPTSTTRLHLFAEWHTERYIVRHDALVESVRAKGALVRVFSFTPPAQELVLRNPASGQQTPARILAMEPAPDGASFMLRLEFQQPALGL